jgi:hypothetical protein
MAMGTDRSAGRRVAALVVPALALALASACSSPAPPAPDTTFTATIAPLTRDAFVQGWDGPHRRIALNRKGADGLIDGYWAAEDGSHPVCFTCVLPDRAGTHRGFADVFPDGDHVVLVVEKSTHDGSLGPPWAEPGKGVYNDVWIARSDGSAAWPVTTMPPDGDHGVIWPRLDAAGTQLTWAEMYQPANLFDGRRLLGSWRLKVADIAWAAGAPRLEHIRTYEPEAGAFYEPYGFSPDGRQVLFASSAFMPGVSDTQIYRVTLDRSASGSGFGDLTRLSDQNQPGWANYNEFAFYLADGRHIVYARTKASTSGGLDYWVMGADGSHPHRLTFLNEPSHPQGRGYTNVGGWAFDPRDPDHFLFGACLDLTCERSDVLSARLSSG